LGYKFEHKETLPTKNTIKNSGFIRFQNVAKSFGKHKVLSEINMEIKPGKIFGIIGINGSGKTTLLKLLVGFYKLNSGVISLNGKNIRQNLSENLRMFGFATQSDSFYGKLTVAENIRYFGELYSLTDEFIDTHMENLLKLVQLWDAKDVLAENLSTGMKRRLDIACALIHDPSILIMDEPTEDLDPNLRIEMLKLIKHINKNGTTIIMTSHLLSEVEAICDNIAILNEGKIVACDSPDNLKKVLKYEEVILRSNPGNYEKLRKKIEKWNEVIGKSFVVNDALIIHTAKGERVLHKLLHVIEGSKEQVIKLDVRKPTLSEVFFKIIKHGKV
jgi:ABC-2 type transport system ATP-binding protein